MSDPVRVGYVVSRELQARRAAQRERGERAREDEFDRYQAEVEACQGECIAPGSTRGGIKLGDGSCTAGMVAVDAKGVLLIDYPEPGGPVVFCRPCFDCNRERWEAWQAGDMANRTRRKAESSEDRKIRQQRQERSEQESFR